jgi:hypothetical protein
MVTGGAGMLVSTIAGLYKVLGLIILLGLGIFFLMQLDRRSVSISSPAVPTAVSAPVATATPAVNRVRVTPQPTVQPAAAVQVTPNHPAAPLRIQRGQINQQLRESASRAAGRFQGFSSSGIGGWVTARWFRLNLIDVLHVRARLHRGSKSTARCLKQPRRYPDQSCRLI